MKSKLGGFEKKGGTSFDYIFRLNWLKHHFFNLRDTFLIKKKGLSDVK